MRLLPLLATAVSAVAVVTFAARDARAEDAVVLASSAPGLSLGQLVADGAPVRLPEGAGATFLLASGRTVSLRGPFEGRVEDGARNARGDPASGRPGSWSGARYAQADLGASRALASAPTDGVPPIDLSTGGPRCVLAGQRPTLARGPGPGAATLYDAEGAGRARLAWDGGRAEWPAELPLADGMRLVVAGEDGSPRAELEIRVIEAETARARGLPLALAAAGCADQARALLAPLREAAVPVEIFLSSDRGQNPTYRRGEPARLVLRANREARVYCLLRDARGDLVPIFPSPVSAGSHLAAEAELEIPGARVPIALNADDQDLRCVATKASEPEILSPSAAFRPLGADAVAMLDRALDDRGRGPVARGQVVLRVE